MKENAMTTGHHFGPFLVSPQKRNGKLNGQWVVTIPKSITGDQRARKFFKNRKLADEYAKRMERRYRRGELSQPEPSPKVRLTFRQAVEDWKTLQRLRVSTSKKREISLKTDGYRLRAVLAFLGDDELAKITETRLVEFQDYRCQQGRTPATINSDMKTVVQILNWAKRNGHIAIVPRVERIPEEPSNAVIPTPAEVVQIISNLPERLRPLVTFIAETGCRSGEAFNLTWDRISISDGYADFKPKDGWTPKTRASIRRVPLSRKLIGILRHLPKDGDYVFRGKVPDRPITNIKKAFDKAVKKANIKRDGKPVHVTPHTLRKAYATWQAINGKVPQRVLKSLLGHSPTSQVTDSYYVIPQEDAIKSAVFELPFQALEGGNEGSGNGNKVATG
ncbi:site-specific integrase [bacterium SCSIO 12827]|nr:site-specific integrase [bacterium SCSIO 12827]